MRPSKFVIEQLTLPPSKTHSPSVSLVQYMHEPFMFSDGTCVPRGTYVATCLQAIHRDSLLYPDGDDIFEGFCFADTRECKGNEVGHLTVTGTDWLEFGHRRHAW